MTTNEPDDSISEAIVRCQSDPALDLIEELRKVTTKPKGIAFLDDMESRREELRKRFKDKYLAHAQFHATPETGAAIRSYHQSVAAPLLVMLLDELVGIHCELALHKSQLGSD